MNETEIDDKFINDAAVPSKNGEHRSTKKKPAPKAPTNDTVTSTKSSEKKRKAPKISVTTDSTEYGQSDETKSHKTLEQEDDTQAVSTPDQEVPIKPKKKRAPKIVINNENNESILTEEPIQKKKSKATKSSPIDDDFQIIETPTIEELEPYVEQKPKEKKSKKSKVLTQTPYDSFENLQVTNLDDTYPTNSDTNDAVPDMSFEPLPLSENGASEYEKAIIDSYNNLASQINFSQYVGDDQWCIIHLPKTARYESKSLIRKMLPGGNKDEKFPTKTTKPTHPKESLLTRVRTGLGTLIRDEKNLIFGERPNYDVVYDEEEEDGIDTDDLHRYAQKLRELEDQDREVNPEFLILRDGKTVYGIHESDADGKVKLATRKPIYDRFADQKPDEQMKKTLLSRLKAPFTRNKDKDGKDSISANTTPTSRVRRQSSRKSLNDDLTTIANDDPLMI